MGPVLGIPASLMFTSLPAVFISPPPASPFLTLRCLMLSEGNYSLHHHPCLLHPMFCGVSCSDGRFGGHPSPIACSCDQDLLRVPVPACCLYQHLQEQSKSVLVLPTSAFLLPHGYFSPELLSPCSWQLPLLLTHVHLWKFVLYPGKNGRGLLQRLRTAFLPPSGSNRRLTQEQSTVPIGGVCWLRFLAVSGYGQQ